MTAEGELVGALAVVTGASSGIGVPTAHLLAEHGASVALVARRRERLVDLAEDREGRRQRPDGRNGFRLAIETVTQPPPRHG